MSNTSEKRREKREVCNKKKFYNIRSLFGYNDTFFYLIIGARDSGKSYSVLDRFIREFRTEGKHFYWLRLTDRIAQDLLQNNASKFIDADLRRKYDLELTVKGNEVFDHGVKMAEIMGISNFYNMKGTASYDCEWKKGYNICLDECQREVGEPVRFDLNYALINALHNYVRDSKEKLRIVMVCNYTETLSDIMNLFNFIPQKWGRYYLKKKKAVVDFIEPTEEYLKRMSGSITDILASNQSTFTNFKEQNFSLVYHGRLKKPIYKMDFGDGEEYVLWLGENGERVIRSLKKGECVKKIIAMRPNIPCLVYYKDRVKQIFDSFDVCGFKYVDLITQQRFSMALQKLKKR